MCLPARRKKYDQENRYCFVSCIGRAIRWAATGAAHTGTAFADSYTQDGKPCPPECVSDSMEIVTWYPSPWNSYDELRSNRIVVGGGDEELNPLPPPKGSNHFLPLNYDPVTDSSGTVSKGLYYYESFTGDIKKFKYTDDGSTWKDLGGGDSVLPNFYLK